ncbi:hypothetical protein CYLTODRAFT_427475 [Cylindrobasidium torrendii FP15055 ss-10]|uniref:Uncharacterized protein n=1 Tax=Cylindrobasidium torrendii FP15055 ss-10 TaxID=1314674 RepID=A0A0D7ATN5_9AGAR|nr:hypothetical protein CYLTODRAFT_427475 [Cylindrobasidium torrendii FP15055 ss-10]
MHRDICIGSLLMLVSKVNREPFPAMNPIERLCTSEISAQAADERSSIDELQFGNAKEETLLMDSKAPEFSLNISEISRKIRSVWIDADIRRAHIQRDTVRGESASTCLFIRIFRLVFATAKLH